MWSHPELRVIATDFLRSKQDWEKFPEEFRILLATDNPGPPDLYQLVHTLEGNLGT